MESEIDGSLSLERALAKTQADADAVIKAAAAVSLTVKRLRSAAKIGDLHKMRPSITAAAQAIAALGQQFANAKDGWDFDVGAYFGKQSLFDELVDDVSVDLQSRLSNEKLLGVFGLPPPTSSKREASAGGMT